MGTEPLIGKPCEAPVTAEIDGLPLCERHAREFKAQARADVLDVAALHLSRWSGTARDLCNDELVQRLQTARGEVEAERKRAHEALERARSRGGAEDATQESFEPPVSGSGRGDVRPEDRGAMLGTILDNLDEGVLATDLEGNVVFANPCAQEMQGVGDGEQLKGVPDPWEDFDLPEAVARCAGRRERVEAMAHGEGTSFRVKLEYLPELDEYGGGVLAVIRTTSEEDRLEERQQQFLATAAHELKTPLTVILIASELLLEGDDDPEMRRRLLRHIHSQAERMRRLSESLLKLARTGVDLREPDLRPVAMSFLEEVAERAEPLVEGAGLSLVLDDRGGYVLADSEWLEQALLILVSNAVKHSERGGRVWLRVEGGTITVEDEGEGIREEDLPRIFERHYRGEGSTSGGAGLGLPICKELVERMDGEISIDSEEGVGTTVRIALPEIAPDE